MPEQVIPIYTINLGAHLAAGDGTPFNAYPLPVDSAAALGRHAADAGIPVSCCPFKGLDADRWRRAWHQRDAELQTAVY